MRVFVNCQERKDLLLLYAAGELDAAETKEMRNHLATGCPTCTANLAEAQAVWTAIPMALESVPPPSSVKRRLMDRIADKSDRFPDSMALRLFRILVPAAVAAGIAIVVTHAILSRQINALQRESAAARLLLEFQNQHIQSQHHIDEMLRSPEARLIKLDATKLQPGATANIVWDQKANQWQLLAAGMAAAPSDKTYELWFVTKAGQKVPAGTFNVDSKGEAALLVKIPPNLGPLALAAVTDEPAGGVPQPTGNFQLTGKIE
jgi:anti-sigma-K factor RskA